METDQLTAAPDGLLSVIALPPCVSMVRLVGDTPSAAGTGGAVAGGADEDVPVDAGGVGAPDEG